MSKLNKEDIELLKIVTKTIKHRIGSVFTEAICDDNYSDNRLKKRTYLTNIEVKITKEIDGIIKSLEDTNNKEA